MFKCYIQVLVFKKLKSMKVLITLTCMALCFSFCLRAQNASQIKIKAEQQDAEILAMKEFYRYPQFTYGEVHFRSGTTTAALLNYNLLLALIQFVNPEGDTLNLTDEKNVKFIAIAKDTFLYDRLYLMQVDGRGNVKLAKHQKYKIGNREKNVGYGYSSSAGAIETYGSVYNSGEKVNKLTKNENLIMIKEEQYFIGDKYNHFFAASKKNLLKAFAKQKDKVDAYLNQNTVAFNKEADLQKLVSFLQTL